MVFLEDVDTKDYSSYKELLDEVAEKGVPVERGRAFSTWLEGVFEELDAARAEIKELSTYGPDDPNLTKDAEPEVYEDREVYDEDDCEDEGCPQYGTPHGHGKPFYYVKKPDAEAAARELKDADPVRIRRAEVQFEPYNGWVIVLYPGNADLSKYAKVAEIDDGTGKRSRPEGVRTPYPKLPDDAPRARATGTVGSSQPSPKGATGKVWEIADAQVAATGGVSRPAIIAACVAAGINSATAGTQYSKWKKARGH